MGVAVGAKVKARQGLKVTRQRERRPSLRPFTNQPLFADESHPCTGEWPVPRRKQNGSSKYNLKIGSIWCNRHSPVSDAGAWFIWTYYFLFKYFNKVNYFNFFVVATFELRSAVSINETFLNIIVSNQKRTWAHCADIRAVFYWKTSTCIIVIAY